MRDVRLYLNTSALNRPFDDLSQDRVRHEADAVTVLLAAIERREIEWITSEYLAYEVAQMPDPERRHRVASLAGLASRTVSISPSVARRARDLERFGLRGLDALHIAAAESASCDCLVTTDDRMLHRAARAGTAVHVPVLTPARALEGLPRERKR